MSVKKIELELGSDHIIARLEFYTGSKATVVGVDGDSSGAITWVSDAEEAVEKELAERLVANLFGTVLDTLMPSEEPADEQAQGADGK